MFLLQDLGLELLSIFLHSALLESMDIPAACQHHENEQHIAEKPQQACTKSIHSNGFGNDMTCQIEHNVDGKNEERCQIVQDAWTAL